MSLKILKFGGTSVGSPEAVRLAVSIIQSELPHGGVVVVSALSGTTDRILEAIAAAARGEVERSRELHQALWTRHGAMATSLLLGPELERIWKPLFERLAGLLEGMGLLWEATPRAKDAALAIGETLSAHLVTALLNASEVQASFLDVREVMLTDGRHGRARPRLGELRRTSLPWSEAVKAGRVVVTQGFLGQAPDGATTTLGRGGSDTSATLLGEAMGADEVQIWTDVDGVLTADPSLVPAARPIPVMSLEEASALSAFGAKVLHADSLAPVARAGFRLVVANTHRPEASRTAILREAPGRRPGQITSVAYKEGLACLRFPPERELETLLPSIVQLQEAGAVRYGLLSTPEGSLLVVRPESPAASAAIEQLREAGVAIEQGWCVVALVGDGLHRDHGACQRILAGLQDEAIAGILAGGTGISLAFLVREERLRTLIPRLHQAYVLGIEPSPSPIG
ncbi:MAG: aspartate kinase [Holophagales bacterium]|nr:aspartate kinase [Holophagales bacterium]